MTVHTFTFPAPTALLSMNDRQHWRPRARLVHIWRTAAWATAMRYMDDQPAGPAPTVHRAPCTSHSQYATVADATRTTTTRP